MKCSTVLTSYQSARLVARVKGGFIEFVYQKIMKARTIDLDEIIAIALMETNIERIDFNFLQIHELWIFVIEIDVIIWLLEQQIFLICLTSMIVIFNTYIIFESNLFWLIKAFNFHFY